MKTFKKIPSRNFIYRNTETKRKGKSFYPEWSHLFIWNGYLFEKDFDGMVSVAKNGNVHVLQPVTSKKHFVKVVHRYLVNLNLELA